jgi:stringent starvation protein B
LHIENDAITFSARFGGVSQNLYVPMSAVRGIFARENGRGMFFEIEPVQSESVSEESGVGDGDDNEPPKPRKPFLKVIK